MYAKFTEIKRHINKETERYQCDLIRKESGFVALRYVSDRKFASTRLGITFPPGCVTIALYWEERPYVFWGIFAPDGKSLGYLVHICRDLRISDGSVSYLDMLLDIWFFPEGEHMILDADEVEECLESGLINDTDKQYIDRAGRTALADFSQNAEMAQNFADTLDFSGPPN